MAGSIKALYDVVCSEQSQYEQTGCHILAVGVIAIIRSHKGSRLASLAVCECFGVERVRVGSRGSSQEFVTAL